MTWLDAEERFKLALPNYESRPQQRLLATEIEKGLANGEVIIGQAGCGVGKSFAVMIPLIEHALESGQPVALSTATKQLQGQYVRNDVPFLKEHSGLNFTATVLKGRGNYVCRAKLAELKPGDIGRASQLLDELEQNPDHSGDLDDLTTPIEPRERPKLVSSSEECPGKRDCPFGDVCFAEAAKQRAKESDVVIVNHAALAADLKIKQEGGFGMLPEFGAIGIDESHKLEDYVTSALGAEFTQRGMQNLTAEAANVLGQVVALDIQRLNGAIDRLFTHLKKLIRRTERTAAFGPKEIAAAEDVLGTMLGALNSLKTTAENFRVGDDRDRMRLKRLKKRINSLFNKLKAVVFADSEELVRWVEADDKRGVVLKYAPLHVGDFLREMIWDRGPAALVSATVAIGDDFSFVAERHGIKDYRAVDAGTPFDFANQAALYVPQNCVPAGDGMSGWKMNLRIQALDLIRASGGRTLMLFSSRSNMEATHTALKDSLEDMDLQVLMQGQGTVRELSQAFKDDETSVLFGLESFATGFDVQGDALRLVIIDKMPFPVPSDVIYAARAEQIDKVATNKWVDGAFPKLSVPIMALGLLQEAGRLIRTIQDEGLIAIFDTRLLTKPYGKKIMRALPPARRVDTLAEASGYLSELSTRRG